MSEKLSAEDLERMRSRWYAPALSSDMRRCLDHIAALEAEIERLTPLAEYGRSHLARAIVAEEKLAGNDVTFDEAYAGTELVKPVDIFGDDA